MQIIILAAGKGTRMKDLSQVLPKPMLLYQNKNLLEHKLEALPSSTTEIIFVIGYLGDKIKEYFGNTYKNIPITYIEQTELKGTAHALWLCKDILHDSFMILMGDDIYDQDDLETLSCTPSGEWSILTYPDNPTVSAGKIVKNNEGYLQEIYNDFDGTSPHTLLYTGACVLTPEIFSKDMVQISSTEYGLPQSFTQFAQQKNIQVFETKNWVRITAPEDLK